MRILVLQHHPDEGPGTLGGFLQNQGAQLETVHTYKGEDPPVSPEGFNAVVSMGGPMNVYQEDQHPWLKKENQLLATSARAGLPIMGICLGAQLIAKALGAKVVIGIDVVQPKLERALEYGADYIINARDKDIKALKGEHKAIAKKAGVPSNYGWKIFECTGVTPGQDIALGLLSFIGKLIVVGFSPKPNTFMISKLMAFDAEMIGTWACLPKYYKTVLAMVQDGRVQIQPFLETKPMSQIEQVFEQQHSGLFDRRQVLVPDF